MPETRRTSGARPAAPRPPAPEPQVPPALQAHHSGVLARLRDLSATVTGPAGAVVATLAARPGKALRSSLLGACAGLGAHDPDRVLRLGAVVELLHLASLLHDDVIDRAGTRRGAPTAYATVGGEMATLAGLSCFALAGTEAADLGGDAHRLVSRTAAELAYGELLDIERAFDLDFPFADYLDLVARKTGELFRLCCVLGAREASLGEAETGALARFGLDLGVAFQVLDDCLDLDPGTAGKPAGTDHMLGLFGAPVLCALPRDSSGELAALLVSPSLEASDLAEVRARVVAVGGLAAALRVARERHDRALAALDTFPVPARETLTRVAHLAWRDLR